MSAKTRITIITYSMDLTKRRTKYDRMKCDVDIFVGQFIIYGRSLYVTIRCNVVTLYIE